MKGNYLKRVVPLLMMVLVVGMAAGLQINTTTPSDGTTDTDGDVNFSATLGVSGDNLSSCNLIFTGNTNPGQTNYSMTLNSNTSCSYQITNIPDQSYDWRIDASNSTTTLQSSTNELTVSVGGSAGAKQKIINDQEEQKQQSQNLKTLGIIALIGIAAWYFNRD